MSFRLPLLISLILGSMFVPASVASSQSLPAYVPPTNKIGGGIASGIAQTLIRRGFAANDPRIYTTIRAVGARVAPLAAAAGSGATWLTVLSRLNLWAAGAVLLYQGITWYFDSNGKVVTKIDGEPIESFGVAQGGVCYFATGASFSCFGTPQEAFIWYQITNTVYNKFLSVSLTAEPNGTPAYNNGVRYSAKGTATRADNPSIIYTTQSLLIYVGTASMSCPGGQGIVNGACATSHLDKYTAAGSTSAPQTYQVAYDALPQEAKDARISPELLAEEANRHWIDAASQPGYDGVPFDVSKPVTNADLIPHRDAHPNDWPRTSDLVGVIPTSPVPIQPTNPNPDQVNPPSSAVKVDLGPDPGIKEPTLEQTPTDIFKPVADLLKPWTDWTMPTHTQQCPTWQAAPSIAGHSFSLDLSYHCTLADQYRAVITAAALLLWTLIAAFIVLSA
jgi:hypothetical protein